MKQFLQGFKSAYAALMISSALFTAPIANAQQLTNADFEDWSGAAFDGNAQPKGWNASNVTQFGFKFNFAHKEAGRNGGYSMMVQDKAIGAAGMTETSPGYFSLGQPWIYVASLTKVSEATAGTHGGISWTHRPDTMSVWIKRTGDNVTKEDFYLLYYAWTGTSKGTKYKGKNGNCTSVTYEDEESDIRQALDGNECGTDTKATQICEGMWREKKQYGDWTNIRVPIYYMNNTMPTKMNIIFSASNYPNFRATTGLYNGNSLYIDDVELVYSASIQKLYVDGVEWKGFNPNSTEVQSYPLGEDATVIPSIEAVRGAGSLTNAAGKTVNFPGRTLTSSEITVTNGNLTNTPTTITVKSADGKTTKTYKIQFLKAASSNTKLAGISYSYKDKKGNTVIASVPDFSAAKTTYNVELPYGTSVAPVLVDSLIDKQEDKQKLTLTQASSVTGTATIKVTAPNNKATATYTLNFSIAKLADNALVGIKINGQEIPGFTPNQTVYKVSLPVGTSKVPTIEAVSEYPSGAQTIEYTLPAADKLDGGQAQIKVTTPGNQTPKTYKLNFKLEASSYSYLKNITVTGDQVYKVNPAKPSDSTALNFAADNLTYYVTLKMGTKTLPTIKAEKGDEYQSEPVIDTSAGVDGTTRITATAANGDQTIYKVIFTTMKSEISILYDLRVGGKTIDGFKSSQTTYDFPLEIGATELPEITYTADEYAEVKINKGGVNGTTRITVVAGNGNTTVYLINFSVESYTNNTLKSIYVAGTPLPDFDEEKNEYSYVLPKGTTELPAVTPVKQDEKLQTVNTRDGGVNGDYRITVRPQSGASRTYIIHFQVETSNNNALKMIYLDNKPLEGFDKDVLEYTYNLEEGVSTLPSVRFDKDDVTQRVLSVQEDTIQTITVTAENGDKRIYTINFHIQLSANAFLRNIYLTGANGVRTPIETPFDSTKTQYEVELTTERAPQITVDKNPGQQVTITMPVAAGTAVILVAPEQGAPMEYRVKFVSKPIETVQLKSISIDGVPMEDYEGTHHSYEKTYYDHLPEVIYETIEGQTAQLIWNDTVAWIHVEDTLGYKATYHIAFSRAYHGNAQLAAIKADGERIKDFAPENLNYDIALPAGSKYPTLTYERGHESQNVLFGQVGDGEWNFIVTADNGSSATYKVKYSITPYTNDTLTSIALEGYDINFNENTFVYENIPLDEGAEFPDMTITPREGQKVLTANISDTEQRILITAEDGSQSTYTIRYTRVKSTNATLAGILLDGKAIEGFRADSLNYVDSLALGTKVIPSIFPIAALPTQTIVTNYCYPNGTATITVTSQDGSAQTEYTIAFPVHKSSNTALESMYLNSDEVEIDFKENVLEYEVELPYQAKKCPEIVWAKAEPSQRVDLISRPMNDTTELKVTAENGDTRTYKIFFKETLAEEANRLSALSVIIDDDVDGEVEFSLKDKTKRNFELTLPYNARKVQVKYTKMYDEQTVFVQPGGVNNTTKLFVKSNRPGEDDEVYNIIPVKTTQNPAILNSIKVDGVDVEDFDPNRFTYIVNRTTKSYPKVVATKNSGVETEPESSMYKWQCTVSKDGVTNVYTLFFHYVNEIIPNRDFTEWETAQYNNGAKPTGWQVPADFFEKVCVLSCSKTGSEVVKTSSSVVGLETTYWSAAGGALPAIITLGKLSGAMAVDNQTHYEFYDYIDFHNTPDAISVNYKHQTQKDNGAFFAYRFKDASNDEYIFDFTDNSTSSSFKTKTQQLTLDGKAIVGMNIAVDATNRSAGASKDAKLYVDWFELFYNSTPKDAKVNGIDAVLNDKKFTVTLTDPEDVNIRSYEFNGEVSDQAQKLNGWSAETVSGDYGERTTAFTNYAEDGTSTTGYSLTVRRPLDTRNELADLQVGGKTLEGFVASTDSFTYVLKSTEKQLPDVYPVPLSSLQTITCAYADSLMTITVTPEKGEAKVYKLRFVTALGNDTKLATLKVGDQVLDVEERNHEITAGVMPDITFVKLSDLQVVVVNNGIVTVTAEDGTEGTYTITRNDTIPTKGDAQLKDFVIDGTDIASDEFGLTAYSLERERPSSVAFKPVAEGDIIVMTQTPDSIEWTVAGNTNSTYTLSYPTDKSTDSQLANITLNGITIPEFDPSYGGPYTVYSDSIAFFEVVRGDEKQTLEVSQSKASGPNYAPAKAPSVNRDLTYTIKVTPEEGETRTYTLNVKRPQGTEAELSNILIDGVALEGFRGDSLDYKYIIPSPAVKTKQPQMPSITYIAGERGQVVEQTNGTLSTKANPGEQTSLVVTAEGVNLETGIKESRTYNISVEAEPSHCTALTGIMVNGVAVDHFEPGRHYYSLETKTSDIEIVATADDRFLTYTEEINGTTHTLHVVAEDGVTEDFYDVDIFITNKSNDTKLANIMLEVGDSLVELNDFEHVLNPGLKFNPLKPDYEINLPSGTKVAPSVVAQMGVDGQKVEVKKNGMDVTITVTAPDGVSKNDYILNFETPKSTDANLSMIFLNGDSLPGFTPDYYFYQINLAEGVHELPEVVGQKGEAHQKIGEVKMDSVKHQATISVVSEDLTRKNSYVIVFHYTLSEADTLKMIYADGDSLDLFSPKQFFYNDSLPVGSAFPDISWAECDKWQKITMDTALIDRSTLIRQIHVTAESGKKNTYTLTYNIRQSEVDTLQAIYLDTRELANFQATTNEYFYTLTAAYASELGGRLPNVEFIKGDTAQTVLVTQAPDYLESKSLGFKSLITVTAASGKTRTYTIHYPVEKSNDATLNMIMLSGKPINGYDSERSTYRLQIDARADLPLVSVVKKEEAQTYDIRFSGDSIYVDVTAENGDVQTYSLYFERLESANANLNNIIVEGHPEFRFRSDEYDYQIFLPFGEDSIPAISWVLQDSLQTVPDSLQMDTTALGDIIVTLTVVAPNKEDEMSYVLVFTFGKNGDNDLLALYVDTTLVEGFDSRITEYTYVHPFGSDSTAFLGIDRVHYILSDSLATDTAYIDEQGVITVIVRAQNGDEKVYIITQEIALDGDNTLRHITLDGETIRGFDPAITFYTHLLVDGAMPPALDALAQSPNASVNWRDVQAGDTCIITVTAQDKEERKYYVHFAISTINDGLDATVNDVLVKVISPTQLFVATIRKNVSFALYNQGGNLLYYNDVPVANPNDVDVYLDAQSKDVLNDVTDADSGRIIDIHPGQIYFYSFYLGGKQKIKSDKLIVQP
ncbi:MAG: hypothetical protein ACI4AI_03890 [Paludibacteraceae bacterium]